MNIINKINEIAPVIPTNLQQVKERISGTLNGFNPLAKLESKENKEWTKKLHRRKAILLDIRRQGTTGPQAAYAAILSEKIGEAQAELAVIRWNNRFERIQRCSSMADAVAPGSGIALQTIALAGKAVVSATADISGVSKTEKLKNCVKNAASLIGSQVAGKIGSKISSTLGKFI